MDPTDVKRKVVIWTEGHTDLVAGALMEAFRLTGFDVTSPYQRDGVEKARTCLMDMMMKADKAFDARRFLDKTQGLSSAIARDEMLGPSRVDDDDDKDDEPAEPEEAR